MLDSAQMSVFRPVASSFRNEGFPSETFEYGAPRFGIRALLGRFADRGARRFPDALAPPAPMSREEGAPSASATACDPELRARAQAAYRMVDGAADRALDAALGVMEAEIGRLRDAVVVYGETLKSIQVYASDDDARRAARGALRARPQRLDAAQPAPRLSAADAGSVGPRHG